MMDKKFNRSAELTIRSNKDGVRLEFDQPISNMTIPGKEALEVANGLVMAAILSLGIDDEQVLGVGVNRDGGIELIASHPMAITPLDPDTALKLAKALTGAVSHANGEAKSTTVFEVDNLH